MITANKVLFLGNSITTHPPLADSGWDGVDWGMTASAPEKDYVHLILKRFADIAGKQPVDMTANIADFERNHASYDFDAVFKQYADFGADIVILAIGENVPELASQEARMQYLDSLRRMLNILTNGSSLSIFMRSSFFSDRVKDGILRQMCDEFGGTYVDIHDLCADESNHARSEHEFQRTDVGDHPGDKGMACIADAIWNAIEHRLGNG